MLEQIYILGQKIKLRSSGGNVFIRCTFWVYGPGTWGRGVPRPEKGRDIPPSEIGGIGLWGNRLLMTVLIWSHFDLGEVDPSQFPKYYKNFVSLQKDMSFSVTTV